jgi:hypothetical protein
VAQLWLSCGSVLAHFTCQHAHNLVRGTTSQPVNQIKQTLGGCCPGFYELSGGMLRYLWFVVVAMLASCKGCSGRQPISPCKPKSVPSTSVRTRLANGRNQASPSVPNASSSAVWTAEKTCRLYCPPNSEGNTTERAHLVKGTTLQPVNQIEQTLGGCC